MNLPSVKTLMRIGPLEHNKDAAKLLRKVLESYKGSQRAKMREERPDTFAATSEWLRHLHNPATPPEVKMPMANDIIGGFGVEYCGHVDMRDGPPLEYVNLGDTYDTTLCRFQGRYVVCSWGDIVERHEKLFRDE